MLYFVFFHGTPVSATILNYRYPVPHGVLSKVPVISVSPARCTRCAGEFGQPQCQRRKFGQMDQSLFTRGGLSSKEIKPEQPETFSGRKRRSNAGAVESQSSFTSIPLMTSQSTFNLSTRKFSYGFQDHNENDDTLLLNRQNFRSSHVNLSQLLQQKKLKDALRSAAASMSN